MTKSLLHARYMRRVYAFCGMMCVLFFGGAASILLSVNTGHEQEMRHVIVLLGIVTLVLQLSFLAYCARWLWKRL